MLRVLHHPNGPRNIHLGGWKKQLSDPRDAAYAIKTHRAMLGAIAPAVDNRSICSPIEDQGELGSCTANMFAGLIESNEVKRGAKLAARLAAAPVAPQVTVSSIVAAADGSISYITKVVPAAPAPTPPPPAPPAPPAPTPTPPAPTPPAPPAPPAPHKLIKVARLFEYYATRKIEGTVGDDSGATIRDAIKAGVVSGVADEATYPYDITKFTVNPPQTVWTAAAAHKVTSYHAISDGDVETMKATLASQFLVGFGFQVYDAFMSSQMATQGLLCRPTVSESLQGGHAVCLVGYDDNKVMPDGSKGAFLVRNSWGTGWGWQGSGYFYMSYNYVSDPTLCSDFWVVQSSPV